MNTNNEHPKQAPDVRSRNVLGAPTRVVLGEMNAKLERLFLHDQQHVALLSALRDSWLRLEARTLEHDKLIQELDEKKQVHESWRDKVKGVYVGVGVTLTTLASILSLVYTLLEKK